jgi:chemotaxis protein methyltransferase CheR
MTETELTLHEIQSITAALKKYKDADYNNYVFLPLKRSFEKAMNIQGVNNVTLLLDKIKHDKNFSEEFLKDISFESTEMFRDPTFWSYIRDFIMPSLLNRIKGRIKVWFPYCVSGDELFSFLIMLHEMEWTDKTDVEASSISKHILNNIKTGFFKHPKLNISVDNYINYKGKDTLSHYLHPRNGQIYRDVILQKNVKFTLQAIPFDDQPSHIHLIIFRNKMIYMEQQLQDQLVSIMHSSLVPGGLLALGVKENIDNHSKFKMLYREECIYIKN